MFSLVLKNSILMILLIMIVHFMIINYLCDLQRTHNKKSIIFQNKNKITTSLSPTVIESETIPHTAVDVTDHNKLQDLYDFVYSDDNDDALNTFFVDDSEPCKVPSDLTVPCADQPIDTEIMFCKNDVDLFYEKNKKELLNEGTVDNSTLNGNPIVYEYREDDHDSLQGFEGFSSAFMPIKN